MSETFTPGPWEWWTSNSLKRLTSNAEPRLRRDGDVMHAYVGTDGAADINVSSEDMDLIAAAPELYAALESIVSSVARTTSGEVCQTYDFDDARSALAKARGEKT